MQCKTERTEKIDNNDLKGPMSLSYNIIDYISLSAILKYVFHIP